MNKSTFKTMLRRMGLEVRRVGNECDDVPVEFCQTDRHVLDYVIDNKLTLASRSRVVATIMACKYVVRNKIPGDFVECGVWRGGNAIAARMTFEALGSDRSVWLFDTYAGMTAPTEADQTRFQHETVEERFQRSQQPDHNDWCFASLEDVRNNFQKSVKSMNNIHFVKGDVLKTLEDKDKTPTSISVLRLDTDWYESTKKELEILYPRLQIGGVLIIDDYGHWDGARKAVEEYFSSPYAPPAPMLQVTDYTGRAGVRYA